MLRARSRESKRRHKRTRSAATRHSDDLRIAGTAVPEREENHVGVTQPQFGRTRRPVVENVLVEQFMKAIDRDAEHASGFAFGVAVSLSSVIRHIRPRGTTSFVPVSATREYQVNFWGTHLMTPYCATQHTSDWTEFPATEFLNARASCGSRPFCVAIS